MNQRLYYISAAMIIFVISIVSYYPALSNGFISNWDDAAYMLKNPHIQQLSLENIKWMFTAFYAANWHPLTWFSHAVDYAIYGENAWGHHLTSIIFHALNSVWVFLFTIILFSIAEKEENKTFQCADIFNTKRFVIALLTGILFAIHPQHVESVAWVAERKDMLFFFFFMPSLISYLIYTQVHQKNWYVASLILFVLSLLSKPMAIMLPFILILFDMYPLKQLDFKQPHYKQSIVNKIPFLIIAMLAGIFTLLAQSDVGAVASIQEVELKVRILNAFHSLVAYFEKWLLPLHLSPFYQLQIFKFQSIGSNLINLLTILITTVVVSYFWVKSQKGWLFYIITLLPVLGLLQVGSQGMADRYAYLPTLPFYILLSVGLVHFYQKYSKLFSVLFVIGINVMLFHLTQNQIGIWRNELTLWDYVVRADPDSSLSQSKLGMVQMQLGHYELASKHFEFSVGLGDRYSVAHYELGHAYLRLGKIDEALREFQIAIDRNNAPPKTEAEIYFNMALIYLSRKEMLLTWQALEHTLQRDPQHLDALNLKKDLQK